MEYTMDSFIKNVINKSVAMKKQYDAAVKKQEAIKKEAGAGKTNAEDDPIYIANKFFLAMCQLHNDEILKGNLSWFGSDDSIKKLDENFNIDTTKLNTEKYVTPLCTVPSLLEKDKGDAFVKFFQTVKQASPENFTKSGEPNNKITNDIIDAYKTVTDTKSEFDYKKYMKAMTKLKYVRKLHAEHKKSKESDVVKYGSLFVDLTNRSIYSGIDNYTEKDAQREEAKAVLDDMIFEPDSNKPVSGARFFSKGAKETIEFFAKEGMVEPIMKVVDTKSEGITKVETLCNLKNLEVLKKVKNKYQALFAYTSASDEIKDKDITDKDILKLEKPEDVKKYIFASVGKKTFTELAPAMVKYKKLSMVKTGKHSMLNVSDLKDTIARIYKDMESDNYAITSVSNTEKYNKMSKNLKKIATAKDNSKLMQFLSLNLDDTINMIKEYRSYKLKDTRNSQRGNNRLKCSSKALDVLTKFKDDLEYSKTTNFSDIYKDKPELNNKMLNYLVIREDNLGENEASTSHEAIKKSCEKYNDKVEEKTKAALDKKQKVANVNKDKPNLFEMLNPII